MWKGFKEFYTYTRKQRNGLLALVAIAFLLQLALYFDDFWVKSSPADLTKFQSYVEDWERQDSVYRLRALEEGELFYFDPNTASDSALQTLGFPPRLAATAINYREKGGQYREPKDLQKLYGMDSLLYERISSYVRIHDSKASPKRNEPGYHFSPFDVNKVTAKQLATMGLKEWEAKRIITYREKVKPYDDPRELFKVYHLDSAIVEALLPYASVDSAMAPREEKSPPVVMEINTADSVQLLTLTGIGPAYASRICRYRERLGGFYNKEQLLEVYGMDEERLKLFEDQLTLERSSIKKININTATFKELLSHPYLEYEVVKNIVNFRERVRPYRSIDELQNIELIDERLFSKIANYVTTSESASQ